MARQKATQQTDAPELDSVDSVRIVKDGCSSLYHDGIEYRPDKAGVFMVPSDTAQAAIENYGFAPAD